MYKPVTVFLDIDGVLVGYHSRMTKTKHKDEDGVELFEDEAVETLNEMHEHRNMEIVISSSWRILYTLDTFQKMFEKRGILAPVVGVTKTIHVSENRRGHEISQYMDCHDIANDYIIIEDEPFDVSPIHCRIIQPQMKYGLQRIHTQRYKAMLPGDGTQCLYSRMD